jgi:hypothetical protein
MTKRSANYGSTSMICAAKSMGRVLAVEVCCRTRILTETE